MKKIFKYIPLLAITLFTSVAEAGTNSLTEGYEGGQTGDLLINLSNFFVNVLVPFFLAVAFLMFVWGVIRYFVIGGANDDAKSKGKSLMVYAIAAFVLILIFWGIVNILTKSSGLQGGNIKPNLPAPVPFTMVINHYV